MSSGRLTRRIALAAGGAALVAAGSLTACSPTTEKEAPATSTTTATSSPASSAPAVSPTEKAVGPGGNESFTPTINPTPPGAVCTEIRNGVCVR